MHLFHSGELYFDITIRARCFCPCSAEGWFTSSAPTRLAGGMAQAATEQLLVYSHFIFHVHIRRAHPRSELQKLLTSCFLNT
ncbi:hypothetical protein NPIL_275531 [Nephila pilipes]|uniref:Uncharacterized protein n=1 Tax=Nephila pilipes TaxID=299642 RepID=A0A8X6Q8A0_NEPPI|nr:hypothetical protein NPIL_275531 [Nephila pilipes]